MGHQIDLYSWRGNLQEDASVKIIFHVDEAQHNVDEIALLEVRAHTNEEMVVQGVIVQRAKDSGKNIFSRVGNFRAHGLAAMEFLDVEKNELILVQSSVKPAVGIS